MKQLSNTAGVYSCSENKAWDRDRADAEYESVMRMQFALNGLNSHFT